MKKHTALPFFVFLCMLSGCGQVSAWLGGEKSPSELRKIVNTPLQQTEWMGSLSQIQAQSFVTARTQGEWQQIWDLIGQAPPFPLPADKMAVGVFMGIRNTGGFGVTIDTITTRWVMGQRDQLVVTYDETTPPKNAMVPQALTSPYAIRLTALSPLDPVFERKGSDSFTLEKK
jgi:hypothetical protein